jgi:hypothetical protein
MRQIVIPYLGLHMPVLVSFLLKIISQMYSLTWGTAVVQWLRYCATNQKVAGSIPDGVIGFFR